MLVIFRFCGFQAWWFQNYLFIDFRKQFDHSFVAVIVDYIFTSFRVENNVLTNRAQKERPGIRSPCMNLKNERHGETKKFEALHTDSRT